MLLSLLESGLNALDITLSDAKKNQLIDYLDLVFKWNQQMNLTGHQSRDKMIPLNILDSLSVLPYLKGKHICDVGTGAGLPGIPLAIADPSREYTLVDSRFKRVQFLRAVCRELKLNHVVPVTERAEKLQLSTPVDTLVARAVTDAQTLIDLTRHLLAPSGQWLLMKGLYPTTELKSIELPHRVETLKVPHLDAQRCVIIVSL